MVNRTLFAILLLSFSFLSPSDSYALKPVRIGGQASTFSTPFPGLVGLGPAIMFFDILEISAGLAPVEWMFAPTLGASDFLWGLSARLHFPLTLGPIGPTAGVTLSRRHIHAPDQKFYGQRREVETYLTPFVGVDLNLHSQAYLSIGLQYVLQREEEGWKRVDIGWEPPLNGTALCPFVQLSVFIL